MARLPGLSRGTAGARFTGTAVDAKQRVDAALAPVRGDLPDLPDVFPWAPALKDLLPPDPNPSPSNRRPQRFPEDDDEDFSTRSVLRGGDR